MKYASEQAKTACRDEMTVTFFFNARGAALGKSTEGMYRCLLHQMADRVPQLPSMVKTKARRSCDAEGWPLEKLKAMFREATFHISRETRLSFYIDALDEGDNEDQVRDMAGLFYETAQKALSDGNPFYVCLASRHYPKISVRSSEELRMEDHNGHHNDIAGYVHNKLRLGNGQLEEELATEILHKSSGVFLWVVLVVAILNKEGDRGNQHLLREQLQRIPTGLFDLLEEIRNQDASDQRFLPAIRWVLFSCVPLKAEELYYTILVSTGQLNTESVFWNRQVIDARVINDFILSSSKGLVEIGGEDLERKHNVAGTPAAGTSSTRISRLGGKVQFIHEVVREYFLKHGLTELDPKALDHPVATSHQYLSRDINTALRDVQHGELGQYRIQMLLRNEADVKSAEWLLHTAIRKRDFDSVEVLLQAGAIVRRHIDRSGDAVQNAARTNDWKIMQVLSNFGADVDPDDFGIGGPYDDPWTAQSNRGLLTDEEVTRMLSAIKRPRTKTVHAFVPV
jgi:hypothetical protein